MVAFVGPSGTGKSTLLNLMLRFYDPTRGRAAPRRRSISARIRIADLRRHMALVGQDSVMLPASVMRTSPTAVPSAARDEIVEAAEMAGAAGFIEDLPDGYDTILTEGGQNLSGGQRQRIAIARALVAEAPFLILDEPTSALDPHHEQRLVQTLDRLKGERTIVLVTHRLESVDPLRPRVRHGGRDDRRARHASATAHAAAELRRDVAPARAGRGAIEVRFRSLRQTRRKADRSSRYSDTSGLKGLQDKALAKVRLAKEH